MQQTYRAALVGCGRMGALTTERTRNLLPPGWIPLSHADAISAHPQIDLEAICDSDRGRLAEVGRVFSIDPSLRFSDFETMLEKVRPDILAIATRTPGRAEVLRKALAGGIRAIHTEKPFTQTLEESESILGEIQAAGISITYGTIRRFMAPFRLAKALVADGSIGTLQEVSISFGHRDLLLWTHPHSVDLLMYFAGSDVLEVYASCDFGDAEASENLIDCDPRVLFANVIFKSGVIGSITASTGMNVQLSGSDGLIRLEGNGSEVSLLLRNAGGQPYFKNRRNLDVPEGPSGTLAAFDDLVQALDAGNAQARSITCSEIALNQRILWAIATSGLRKGEAVRLEDVPANMRITGKSGNFFA
jgi:predicted dehydrogenase